MRFVGYGVAVALSALLTACVTADSLQASRGGIALAIEDDEDALEEAMDRAAAHCEDHGRFAVLQAVSEEDDGERLVTFNCAESRGGGIAVGLEGGDSLEDATDEADDYCDRYARDAVLQSVSRIGASRVAAFGCV